MKRNLFIIVTVLLATIISRAQPVEIYFGSPVPSECGTLAVPVFVNNFSDIGAISLKLNFDNTIFEYQSANLNENIAESVYNGNNANGKFALSFYGDGITFQEGEVLFILHFRAIGTSQEKSELKWDNDQYKENCEFAGPGGVPVYSGTFIDGEIIVPSELIPTISANPILCNGETTEVTVSASGGNAPYNGTGTFTVGAGIHSYVVSDENGCESEVSISIQQPEPLQINLLILSPSVPVKINSNVELVANFTENILVDVNIDWGDGTFSSFENIDDGVIVANHIYYRVGVNSVKIEINDKCENWISRNYDYVVVYDPNGGFVTGGGWFISSPGSYVTHWCLSGNGGFGYMSKNKNLFNNYQYVFQMFQKANFSFNVKYHKGKTVPTGHVHFQISSTGLYFSSTDLEWLVISGNNMAQFKGSGTINGSGNYGFMITAIDNRPDKFRIEIWDKDDNDEVVYDNFVETTILGGSIVIHNGNTKTAQITLGSNTFAEELEMKVYPNPFSDRLRFDFVSPANVNAQIDLYDMNGRLVKTIFEKPIEGGVSYEAEFKPETIISAMYIYRLTMGNKVYSGIAIFKKE